MLLYGCSLTYGFSESTNFDQILINSTEFNYGTTFGIVFILVGLAFKISAVPFHMWAPDVYQGSPTSVTLFFAILPKIAALSVFIKFLYTPFANMNDQWQTIIVFISIASMIFGAVAAIGQKNLKRLIAYSSISHMGFVLIGIGSFSSLGTSGAMLQMVSHGLIGASLFFLVGATYDRTKTLKLDEMGGVGQKMRIMFALWTACSLASLALPGMSGFVSELMVFTGFVTDEVYTLPFRVIMASLAAIGVILTPIYLLSMLREIFFGKENPKLTEDKNLIDAEPREIYIIACLLLPIIGIGLYPRLVTESYLATINNLVDRDLNAVKSTPKTNVFAGNKSNQILKAPTI